jgi:pyruvate ferredoxin oxidoreductase delta subunit
MSEVQRFWQDIPHGGVAFGASSLEVETGLWRSTRPMLDAGRCVSCLRCWAQCPDASILTDAGARVTGVNLFFCKGCGICARVCPVGAISMKNESEFSGETVNLPGINPGKEGELVVGS